MSFLWLPYFPAPYEWHDEGMPFSWSKNEMKQKIKDIHKEVRRKVNHVIVHFMHTYTKLENSKRSCNNYEQKVKQLEARNKQLEMEIHHKEIVIAEMKEEQKGSLLTQKVLVKQLKVMGKQQKVVQDEKDVLMNEKEKLINERNHLAVVAQHTEDKAHKMAEELQQSKSTVKEMGLFLVLRALCPKYLDPWFFVFSVFYLFSKAVK